MDETTDALLRDTIAHWRRMEADAQATYNRDREKPGRRHCSLCARYYYPSFDERMCFGCPVSLYTGQSLCVNTPYAAAADAWHAYILRDDDNAETEWKRAAQVEIAFLEDRRLREDNKAHAHV